MLAFDYVEIEKLSDGYSVYVGLKFADEPDELYVGHIKLTDRGTISELQLLYNGMDCRYEWKPEEREQLLSFVREQAGDKLPLSSTNIEKGLER